MDRLALATLRQEIRDDCRIFREAAADAAAHLEQGTHGRLQATAFELARGYNVFEQMVWRIARQFENNIDRTGEWHERLLRRMTLEVPGVRPALISTDLKPLGKRIAAQQEDSGAQRSGGGSNMGDTERA